MLKPRLHCKAIDAVALLAMFAAPGVLAVTFTVNSALDQPDDLTIPGTCHTAVGTCTLRAAVMQANRTSGAGATIILPAGTFLLTIPASGGNGDANGDLNLTTPASGNPVITITGAGAAATIIDANQLDRVFNVHFGRTASISAMTLQNGFVSAAGGGISNSGSLTVDNTRIYGNQAGTFGGGIYNSGSLTVTNTTISKINVGISEGGGIYTVGGVLNVINTALSQNQTGGSGGGLFAAGTAVVTGSTIDGNTASYGGGVYTNLTLTMTTSTVKQNGASVDGGGIYNQGDLKVKASTLSQNHAGEDGGGIYSDAATYVVDSTISQNFVNNNGGGLYNHSSSGLFALYNASVIGNDADHDRDVNGGNGGGVYSEAGARFIVVNTLIAANTVVDSPIYDDCIGTLEAYGMNLLGDATNCVIPNAGNWGFISLGTIGPLQNNGGPTQTHALLAGSEAIDNTLDLLGCVDEIGTLLTTDQRGSPRVAGIRCDVGAYEYSALAPPAQVGGKSRKVHGAAGTFDLTLGSVATNPTTEPRQGPTQTIVLTFNKPINAATVTISEGTSTAAAPTFSGNDVIVNLTGVTNQQYVTVSLSNVASTDGSSGGAGAVRVGFLLGDVNQSRAVSIGDLGLVNAQLAQAVTAANFLKDVNVSGTLTLADKGITNANLTKALPAP